MAKLSGAPLKVLQALADGYDGFPLGHVQEHVQELAATEMERHRCAEAGVAQEEDSEEDVDKSDEDEDVDNEHEEEDVGNEHEEEDVDNKHDEEETGDRGLQTDLMSDF